MYAVVETNENGRNVILSTFDEDSLSKFVHSFCMKYAQAKEVLRWNNRMQEWFDSLPNKLEIWSVCDESFNIDSPADLELTFAKIQEITNNKPTTFRTIFKEILTMIANTY